MRAVIIDDEPDARENIASILKMFARDVEVVGFGKSVKEGLTAINEFKPDIVFLDVEMSDGTGLDLLKKAEPLTFKVIFITAHQHFAIQAIKFSALDYILKPPDPDEVVAAVEKAREIISRKGTDRRLETFIENLNLQNARQRKIVLRTSENIHVVAMDEIVRFEADVNYTTAFLTNGKKIIVSRTLKEFDDMLKDFPFFRSHRAHLVNLNFIDRYHRADGGYLVMKDGTNISVSDKKREDLLQVLEKM